MSRISVGDASLTNILSRQGAHLRAQVQRTANEVATGRQGDLGQALRGDFSPLLAVDASLARLKSFAGNTAEVAFQTAAQQSALAGLFGLAVDLGTSLLRSKDMATAAQVSLFAADARGRLASAVGLMNAEAGGRAIFAGTATGTLPLGPAEAMLAAMETAAAGTTNASQVADAVATWFSDPAGYAAFYQGGGPLAPSPIASGETVDLATTALDPAIRDTLHGFALAALLDRGVLGGNHEERADLAQRAGAMLQGSQDSRVDLAARIGMAEARIEAAAVRNSAEETALGILRSETGAADPYEAATRLEELRGQLESLYLVTARVSRLSLVDYLR